MERQRRCQRRLRIAGMTVQIDGELVELINLRTGFLGV